MAMENLTRVALMAIITGLMLGGIACAESDHSSTSLADAFKHGTPSGQIRLGYIWLNPDASGTDTTSDFALGGQLKFETASFYGAALGAAFYSSHSLTEPDDEDFNDELSSAKQHYDLLAEAYIKYAADEFEICAGRQLIDTPFADSDDIRLTPHTFEAIFSTYKINNLLLHGGYLTAWQGVDAGYPDDADFDDLVPDSDGTLMLGGSYTNNSFEANLWYYNIADVVDIFYADALTPISFSDNICLTLSVQMSVQNDSTSSKTYAEMGAEIEGSLYGAMAELAIAGLTIGAAYDHADIDTGEALFGGFGGGPFFTNIDTLVANEFAAGQDADSYTLSIGYDFGALGVDALWVGYTYGNYQGGADPMNKTADAEVDEHNFCIEYMVTENLALDALYAVSIDRQQHDDSDWDYERAQVRINFTF